MGIRAESELKHWIVEITVHLLLKTRSFFSASFTSFQPGLKWQSSCFHNFILEYSDNVTVSVPIKVKN